jgi:hypothetical protein
MPDTGSLEENVIRGMESWFFIVKENCLLCAIQQEIRNIIFLQTFASLRRILTAKMTAFMIHNL